MLRSRRPPTRRRRLLVAISLLAAGTAVPVAGATEPAARRAAGRSSAIVVLRPGASPGAVAARHSLRVGEEYQSVFNGFGAAGNTATPRLATDPDVAAVIPNQTFQLDTPFMAADTGPWPATTATSPTQTIPLSRVRIGLRGSRSAAVNGTGPGIDADIAVIDTGLDAGHPDLNVVGGHNCTDPDRSAWQDEIGHGTAVAGVAAMKDNDTGYVGVAPGARLWSVRIFDRDASTTLEGILCAVEWVAEHADVIEVANMSFSGFGRQDGACGRVDEDLFHTAVCRAADSGVTLVAAAGNEGVDSSEVRPASYPEVIAVSALTDTDGRPGGLGFRSACAPRELDDVPATFSNHGPGVDLAAPGVCVDSSLPWFACIDPAGCYGQLSGTSLAAPFVTGAAALLRAAHPNWPRTDVVAFLLANAERATLTGDGSTLHREGVLSVAGW